MEIKIERKFYIMKTFLGFTLGLFVGTTLFVVGLITIDKEGEVLDEINKQRIKFNATGTESK